MKPDTSPTEKSDSKGADDDAKPGRLKPSDWRASDEASSVRRARYVIGVALIVASVVSFVVMWWIKGNQEQAAIDSYKSDSALSSQLSSAQNDLSNVQSQMSDRYSPPSAPVMDSLAAQLKDTQARIADLRTQQASLPPTARAPSEWAATKIVDDRWTTIWAIYAVAIACLILVAGVYLRYLRLEKERQLENRQLVQQIVNEEATDEFDLQNLWEANKKQLQLYHQIVVNYAQSSRQSTQVFLVCGFFFIVLVGVFALTRSTTAGAISSSIVSATGAIVTGFIAQAALKNQDSSSRELVEFFSHPLDVQRALAAERLIMSMPEDDQSKAKLIVVEHLAAAINQRARRAGESKPTPEAV
jgi:uncharacterized membrane-anchored protein YhcB (DUF1043 family)/uncharacterized membrane protein (DUF485 family)